MRILQLSRQKLQIKNKTHRKKNENFCLVKEKLEDLFIMTDNKQEKLKEMITNAVSSAVTSLTKRINDLESKNEELTTKIKELSELINSQNIQGDIKQTTEKTLEHNLEELERTPTKKLNNSLNRQYNLYRLKEMT